MVISHVPVTTFSVRQVSLLQTMQFRMVSSFRMQATNATFFSLPRAIKRRFGFKKQ